MGDWQPIETAPFNREVEIEAGGKVFRAIYATDASMDEDEKSCDQWQAADEDEAPRDWCAGCCWSSNSQGRMSAQPTRWREFVDMGAAELAYHYATTCACTAAQRYVEDCRKHGNRKDTPHG